MQAIKIPRHFLQPAKVEIYMVSCRECKKIQPWGFHIIITLVLDPHWKFRNNAIITYIYTSFIHISTYLYPIHSIYTAMKGQARTAPMAPMVPGLPTCPGIRRARWGPSLCLSAMMGRFNFMAAVSRSFSGVHGSEMRAILEPMTPWDLDSPLINQRFIIN